MRGESKEEGCDDPWDRARSAASGSSVRRGGDSTEIRLGNREHNLGGRGNLIVDLNSASSGLSEVRLSGETIKRSSPDSVVFIKD